MRIAILCILSFNFFLAECSENTRGDGENVNKEWRDVDDPSDQGVVSLWTPGGVVQQDTLWYWFESSSMYSIDSNDLEIKCFMYYIGKGKNDMPIDIYRVSLRSKVEGIEIENFGVTSCESTSLQQSTSMLKKQDGYDYIIKFRDVNGKCYTRTYSTVNTEFSATLHRSDVKQIGCPKELDHEDLGTDGTRMLITDWNNSGEFEIKMSDMELRQPVERINMPGPCAQLAVRCSEHQSFSSGDKLLVADVNAEAEHLRLDRVVVTACTTYALKTSFNCIRHICISNICNTKIGFMKPDGTCTMRSYRSVIHKGNKNNIDHTTIKKGRLQTWKCAFKMAFKGFWHTVLKKNNMMNPTTRY